MRQYTMDVTILSLLTMGICCVSGQMFNQLPSNATAMEGGSVKFNCTVLSEDSSTNLSSVWGVQVPGETELILGLSGVNMSDLKDGSRSTAFIGTSFNSPLTIANVTRSLDETRVRCLFRNGVLMSQGMPYAFLTVLWLDVSVLNSSSALLQVGQNINITVTISGSPVPWIASFVRDDGQNIRAKGNRVSIVGSTITFQDLTDDDVGRYNITVTNGAIERVVFFELTQQTPSTGASSTFMSTVNVGAIVGGIVGGVVLIVIGVSIAVVVGVCCWKKRSKCKLS